MALPQSGSFLTLVALTLVVGALVTVVLLAGCDGKPRAPVLTTEAVYTNDAIKLTLVVPDGWNLYAKANPPPDQTIDHPLRLAAYEKTDEKLRADLELYAIEAGGEPILAYLVKKPIGPDKWVEKGKPETLTINGVKATRHTLAGTRNRAEMRRELTVFERGTRTYLFVLTFEVPDVKHRDQARRAIETATWK